MDNEVRFRNIEPNDLPIFYEQQLDADATRMAAFPARDRAAFDAHWATKILGNPAAVKQTILLDGQVAGHIGSWPQYGVRLVGYWIGKEHLGKSVATRALAAFLHLVTERPLYAHVAKHNVGSIRLLHVREWCPTLRVRHTRCDHRRYHVGNPHPAPHLGQTGICPNSEIAVSEPRKARRKRGAIRRGLSTGV